MYFTTLLTQHRGDKTMKFLYTAVAVFVLCCSSAAKDICSLPKVVGRCRAAFPRYFFNTDTNKCDKFTYGGCDGNANNFETLEDCLKQCGPVDPCKLKADSGPCLALIPRWFYNTNTDKCEEFSYGGCQGNANNFNTLQDCRSKCDICWLPPKTGPCKAALNRFYHNSGKCEMFTYGGCQGNANNFEKIEDCEKRCRVDICTLPVEPGPCKGSFPSWYFDSTSGACKEFIYGGCGGNGNRFSTQKACDSACDLCSLPAKTGPCRAAFKRFYYNQKSGKCEMFTYGGCQPNANNFEKIEECEKRCRVDICTLPVVQGPCEAAIPSWYFDSKSKTCKPFTYGGCDGNSNRFSTKKECDVACDPCSLPPKPGPCKAAFKRFYFNQKSGKCEMFTYGGCQPNANNFETIEACEKRCKVDICTLPVEPGPCRGSFPSWYFDSTSGTCKEFIYGGCGGNDNRFSTQKACESACDLCSLPSKKGPCRAIIPRWFFNDDTGNCEQFEYGGCQANANNFETIEECEKRCKVDICTLPVVPGPCRAFIPSWYFDSTTGTCKEFTYGGCGGNGNRFSTEKECDAACDLCSLPAKIGPCRAAFPRWFFNEKTNECEKFIYGGCQGNANNFLNEKQCNSACRCDRPKDIGPCDGIFPKFFYSNGKCKKFDYGGCGGNGNRFETKEMCLSACKKCPVVDCSNSYCPNGIKMDKKGCKDKNCQCNCKCKGKKCKKQACKKCNVCLLKPDSGCGKKKSKRWFYDSSKKVCVQFQYGGKGGNGNNFKSKAECEKKCQKY